MGRIIRELNGNREKGTITLFVLMACLFFTFVLLEIYVSNLNRLQLQEQQLNQIQNNYKRNIANIQEIHEDLQKKQIKIDDVPITLTYNGKEQKWEPNITDENNVKLIKNKDYNITYNPENCVDAGDIEVTITGEGKYTGEYKFKYTIEKAKLKVKTGSKEKPYDGTALTCPEITIDGFVNGETAKFYTTGTQTEVGSSANSFTIEFDETAKIGNYEIISKEIGTLTVKACIAVTP